MVGLAFTMAEPYPGESRIVSMIDQIVLRSQWGKDLVWLFRTFSGPSSMRGRNWEQSWWDYRVLLYPFVDAPCHFVVVLGLLPQIGVFHSQDLLGKLIDIYGMNGCSWSQEKTRCHDWNGSPPKGSTVQVPRKTGFHMDFPRQQVLLSPSWVKTRHSVSCSRECPRRCWRSDARGAPAR